MKHLFFYLSIGLLTTCSSLISMDKKSQETKGKKQAVKIISNHFNTPPKLLYEELIKNYCNRQAQDRYGQSSALEENREKEVKNFTSLVFEGGKYAYKIIKNGKKSYPNEPEEYKTAVTAVTAFLYSLCLDRNKSKLGATQLAFVLEDPHSYWYEFFVKCYNGVSSIRENQNDFIFLLKKKTKHWPHLKKAPHFVAKLEKYAPNGADHLIIIQDKENNLLLVKPRKIRLDSNVVVQIWDGFKSQLKQFPPMKKVGLKTNDNPTYNKEHYQPSWLTDSFLEIFPTEDSKPTNEIFKQLEKELKKETFKAERKEKIKKLISKIRHHWNNLAIRTGEELIPNSHLVALTAHYYHLISVKPKEALLYYPFIKDLLELNTLIYQRNVISQKDVPMQTLRNLSKKIVDNLSATIKVAPLPLHTYLKNVIQILYRILESKQCDTLLCEAPIFEQAHHEKLIEELQQETSSNDSNVNQIISDEFLVKPTDEQTEE